MASGDAGRVEGGLGRGGDDLEIALRAAGFDAGVEAAQRGFIGADILEADMGQAEPLDLREHGEAVWHCAVLAGEHENEIHAAIMFIAAAAAQ